MNFARDNARVLVDHRGEAYKWTGGRYHVITLKETLCVVCSLVVVRYHGEKALPLERPHRRGHTSYIPQFSEWMDSSISSPSPRDHRARAGFDLMVDGGYVVCLGGYVVCLDGGYVVYLRLWTEQVLIDDAISSVELVNCQRVKVQVRGSVPSVAVDKTDGFLCYLSKDGLETTFVTSKVIRLAVSTLIRTITMNVYQGF